MPLNISKISETFFFQQSASNWWYATQPWLIIYAKVELEVTENGFSTFLCAFRRHLLLSIFSSSHGVWVTWKKCLAINCTGFSVTISLAFIIRVPSKSSQGLGCLFCILNTSHSTRSWDYLAFFEIKIYGNGLMEIVGTQRKRYGKQDKSIFQDIITL